ncbi:hypothetical protein V1283_005255 [Bradyrhizobium sp. AZCC 2262]
MSPSPAEHEAKTQARETIEFSERAQNQETWSSRLRCQRQFGRGVGKTFVDDKTTDARQQREQLSLVMASAVGVVGIDDHGEVGSGQGAKTGDFGSVPTGSR